MDLIDIVIDSLNEDIIYENEHMIVYEIIHEIKVSKTYSKRLQLVKWKNKIDDAAEIDFRTYSIKDNIYKKGITFSQKEAHTVMKALQNYFKEK
ncbi:MAG: hypothetical protein RBQ95_01395 [Paracholeplasma sp.]|nr:hypothetical protein [Paracholeplasma sp.]MDY3195487.1 hypothetical protein [Paracholeplasma sp.]